MSQQPPFRVLLVHLEATALQVLCPGLRGAGYEVACAADEANAVGKAAQWQPSVVVVDLAAPPGPTTAARIRQQAAWRRPLLLGLTEPADGAAHRHADEAGIDLLLLKPIELDRVLGLLERFARVLADTAAFDPMI